MRTPWLMAIMVPCLVLSTAAQRRQVGGDVFIVTKAGINYKLGLVTVSAIPESAVNKHLSRRQEESATAVSKMQTEIDRAKGDWNAALAEEEALYQTRAADWGNSQKKTDWQKASERRSEIGVRRSHLEATQLSFQSGEFFFEGLPQAIASSKTDADGKFSLQLPSGRFGIAAHSSRKIGDTKESYYWLVWLTVGPRAVKRIMLSNDNMIGQGSPESVWK
jgi:hypothetical protein